MDGVVYQSVIFENTGVQISYFDEADRDERGMKIQTVVINPFDLKPELDELFDALTQLVAAWEGLRREMRVPPPRH